MHFRCSLFCLLGTLVYLALGGRAEELPKKGSEEKEPGLKVDTTFMPKTCDRKSATSDMLTMQYTGILAKSGKKFDSSRDRSEPFTFQLGVGQVIKGWDMGLQDMCVGEQRKLTIPSQFGYGDKGAGDKIPPGATLIFEVELVSIADGHNPKTIFDEMDKDSDGRLSKEEVQKYLVKMGRELDEVGMQMEKKDEANSLLAKLFELHDSNEDGSIDLEEFRRPDRQKYSGKQEAEKRRRERAERENSKEEAENEKEKESVEEEEGEEVKDYSESEEHTEL